MPLWAVTLEAVVPGATEDEAIQNAADFEEYGKWQVRMIALQTLTEAGITIDRYSVESA